MSVHLVTNACICYSLICTRGYVMFELSHYITDVPHYPKKDIIFKDITTLLENSEAFYNAIEQMKKKLLVLSLIL